MRGCTLRGRSPRQLMPGERRIRGSRYNANGIAVNANHVLIEDNDIQQIYFIGITHSANARNIKILRNTILETGKSSITAVATGGQLRKLLIEGNVLSDSISEDGFQTNANFSLPADEFEQDTSNRGVVIRKNIFFKFGENAIDIKGSSHIVIDGNIFWRSEADNDGLDDGEPHASWARTYGGGTVMRGSNQSSGYVIVRRNIFFDNNGGIDLKGNRPSPLSWYVYHNTLAGNVRHAYMSQSTERGTSVGAVIWFTRWAFVNNIVVGQNDAAVMVAGATRGHLDHNLYFDVPKIGKVRDSPTTFTLAQWRQYWMGRDTTGRDLNALEADPRFVNAPLRPVGLAEDFDFSLTPQSPALDAGSPLTRTRSAGSGDRLPVQDAGYFFDGFGFIQGDEIQVGSARAVVTAVDLQTNTLTLDRALTWRADDPVSHPWVGAAPDIGACERGMTTCLSGGFAMTPAPPQNQPPQLTLPDSLSALVNQPLTIQAQVSDDGLPAGGRLTLQWSQRSGPAALTLQDPDSDQVRFTPTTPGDYVLELEVSDSALSASAQVTIRVTAQPSAPALALPWLGELTVDGQLKPAWRRATRHPIELLEGTPVTSAADLSGAWRAGWGPQGLYVLIEVLDDKLIPADSGENIANDDSVWVFVDANADAGDSPGADDSLYAYRPYDGLLAEQWRDATQGILAQHSAITGGYQVELLLPWETLGQRERQAGAQLKLDFFIADDDDGGSSERRLRFAGSRGQRIAPMRLVQLVDQTPGVDEPDMGAVSDMSAASDMGAGLPSQDMTSLADMHLGADMGARADMQGGSPNPRSTGAEDGCAAAAGRAPTSLLSLLALLGVLIARRRRRRA